MKAVRIAKTTQHSDLSRALQEANDIVKSINNLGMAHAHVQSVKRKPTTKSKSYTDVYVVFN